MKMDKEGLDGELIDDDEDDLFQMRLKLSRREPVSHFVVREESESC